MRTAVSSLSLVSVRTLREALEALGSDSGLIPLAGATDLYVALNFGTLSGTRFLDLWPLRRLRRIAVREDILSIGALATYSAIARSRIVQGWLPMLCAAAREVGGAQIQNRGTIGGNIANASPAADTLPVLAAADGQIVLASRSGERRVPITRFYTGYRATVRRPDELITAVEIPRVEGEQYFRKVGTRAAQSIAKVVMGAVRSAQPRVALGSVAATVVRLPRTEAALAALAPIDDAVQVLRDEISPIDDIRSTAAYRRLVAGNLLRECFAPAARAP
ncbi:MAG: FAD binding domain-containing protein [Gemmatimonadaceae bacterium]